MIAFFLNFLATVKIVVWQLLNYAKYGIDSIGMMTLDVGRDQSIALVSKRLVDG